MLEVLQLTDSTTEKLFQVPAGKNYAIYNIVFTNISGVASAFNGWLVKNGSAVDNDSLFIKAKSLTAGFVYNFNEKILLGPQDKISLKLDAGTNQINVFINYIEL